MNDIRCVLTARIGDVDDASRLFLLEVVDEAHFEVFGLSQHVIVVEATW